MSWDEVRDLLRETDTVLIPVGSMEQHGPHLPLGTDTFIATEMARRISEKIGIAFTPGIPYGYSIEHLSFPGSVTLTQEGLMSVVKDVCESMIYHGFKKIVLVNGHGGNVGILETLIQSLKAKHKVTLALINITDMLMEYLQESSEPRLSRITHADELETSILMAIDETKVKLNKLRRDGQSDKSGPKTPVGVETGWRAEDFSSSGVIGNLERIDKSEGQRILDDILKNILAFLRNLK
jgi:creatinine amidohydrolase